MVEVFKTNVQEADEAHSIIQRLLEHFPDYLINFDLEDCDKILRIKGEKIDSEKVCKIVGQTNADCSVL
ncbi:MAG: hypothetical protein ACTHJT_10370 [Cytophaga sp.]|uniref:hypothetical protein n=1 Tax=Cytophaga sp. TaxID=29535 RepID=UPI003F81D24C